MRDPELVVGAGAMGLWPEDLDEMLTGTVLRSGLPRGGRRSSGTVVTAPWSDRTVTGRSAFRVAQGKRQSLLPLGAGGTAGSVSGRRPPAAAATPR
ncbi:hypothetical protein GCM10010524_52830 [Streptomyces mexicanus]